MIDVIGSTLTALKSARDLAQGLVELHDRKVVNTKLAELQKLLIDAQSAVLSAGEERAALIDRNKVLEKEAMELKDWSAERENYQLESVDVGAFAYAKKPGVEPTEPPHWLCTRCFTDRKKSVLQRDPRPEHRTRERIWRCTACDSTISVAYLKVPGRTLGSDDPA